MAEPFDFTGNNIQDTYQRVVQTDGTNFFDGTGSAVTFGSPFTAGGISGSSNELSASLQGRITTLENNPGNTDLSALNAHTSSINSATSSFVTNAQTSSFVVNSQTSSFVTNAQTSSFIVNSQTSSFVVNSQTSSFVTNAQTSSFIVNSQTSSFVVNSQTSSFVVNSQTGSFVVNSQTGSFVVNSQTGSFVTNSQTGSFVVNSQTSSFVTTNTIGSINISITADTAFDLDTFNTASINGSTYDYTLVSAKSGSRTGQFFIIHYSGSYEFTDNSTNHIGPETSIPLLSASLSSSFIKLQSENGNGYKFKAVSKKL
jgi:hypothetical protein